MSWTQQQIQCRPTPFVWVGDSVTPMSFAGLIAWWKADSYALADNTLVFGTGTEWLDQSGNGNHVVTRGDNSIRPLFRTNQVNGQPAIVGDGNAKFGWIGASGSLALGNTNWTVIVVTGGLNSGGGVLGRSPGDGRMSVGSEGNNIIATPFNLSGAQSVPFTFGVSHRRMNTYMVRAGFHRYYEGATDRTQVTPAPCTNPLSLNLVMHDGITNPQLNGKLCEIVIYNQARTDADIARLCGGYFKPKYAVE